MTPRPRIRILPEEAVNRVAAGEVVERPAAALKELLENSVDAGAAHLDIELGGAGVGLIRVADDGTGMSRDDLVLALERHATSKIAAADDLARITSFGFRGEALPSIAAIARLSIETRERGSPAGTRLEADGGRILRVAPCGCPEGTQVEVRDLFCTVPARRKFLRSEATELSHCLQVAARLALGCPGVGLRLRHGARELLRLAPASSCAARLREYLDPAFFAGLLPVRGAAGGCAVEGFVSRPGAGRPGAEYQQFFVNGRPVREPLLAQGIREACRELFLQEKHGVSFFLWLALPPDAVDVNVHPTKREVRFREPRSVLATASEAVLRALRDDRGHGIPVPPPPRPVFPGTAAATPRAGTTPAPSTAALLAASAAPPAYAPASGTQAALPLGNAPLPGNPEPAAVWPSQLFGTYLLCPGAAGLVLVDQHAAHERVLYERFLSRPPGAACQRLLEPLRFETSPGEEAVLEELLPHLAGLGIAVEGIGPRAWRVLALPPELTPDEALRFIRELAAAGVEGGLPPLEEFRSRAAALLACHAAVRANRILTPAAARELLADLSRTANPGACPHGRPTSITIGRAEIERRFKRT